MIRALIAATVLLTACGANPSADTPSPTLANTPGPTPEKTSGPATATPSRTPAALDPQTAITRWKVLFDDELVPIITEVGMADAFESDFYWVDSVDRLAYSIATHRFTMDATIGFESVYLRDPQEWRDDTWTLYRAWGRDVWGSIVGLEDQLGGVIGASPDWTTWTPALLLSGNGGRITVECPGELIYAINQRQATQSEFEAECVFSH